MNRFKTAVVCSLAIYAAYVISDSMLSALPGLLGLSLIVALVFKWIWLLIAMSYVFDVWRRA